MARDTVTVPRELLEEALEYFTGSRMPTPPSPFGVRSHGSGPMGSIVRKLNAALLPALQSVEGGVQGSIATKQESCPESAPRTETAVRDWRKSVFTYEHNDVAGHLYYFAPQVTAPGPFLEQRHVQAIVDIASDGTFAGVELIDNMPPLNSGAADTKSDGGAT